MSDVSPESLRELSEKLRHCADRYLQLADMLEKNGVAALPTRNRFSLQKGIEMIGGHLAATTQAFDRRILGDLPESTAAAIDALSTTDVPIPPRKTEKPVRPKKLEKHG